VKLSEWQHASIKPAQEGWYHARFEGDATVLWRYFDGRRWFMLGLRYNAVSRNPTPPPSPPGLLKLSSFGVKPIDDGEFWRGVL